MRGPSFRCSPVDASFFEQAPLRLQAEFEIKRPAAEVWGDLTAEHPLVWCRILKDATWTSERPFGCGTARVARVFGGANVVKERFFLWDEGRRHSFFIEETNSPLFRRFAEDYVVEPTSASSCRFTWTIAAEPRLAAHLLSPLNRRLLSTLFSDTREHYGLAG
jgi:hypothetical protein